MFAHFFVHFIAVNCGDRGRANQADRDEKKKVESKIKNPDFGENLFSSTNVSMPTVCAPA